MVSTVTEETYEELQYLLREMALESPVSRDTRIVIATGEDVFNEHGENLYACS